MKSYPPYLLLLIVIIFLSGGYLARAQQQEGIVQAQDQLAPQIAENAVQQSQGMAAESSESAVVNFSKLASEEAEWPTVLKEPKDIPEPGPGPRRKPASADAGAVIEEQGPEAYNFPAPQPLVASPAPVASFKALEDNNAAIPPDTHGAVGPNHLMVVLNTQVRIQSRTGATVSTVTLDGFWAPLGVKSTFDPHVLYDPYNNRWMFTVVADADLPTSAVLIAVSQTGDPTGNWKLYKVDADSGNVSWADYPTIGSSAEPRRCSASIPTTARRCA